MSKILVITTSLRASSHPVEQEEAYEFGRSLL